MPLPTVTSANQDDEFSKHCEITNLADLAEVDAFSGSVYFLDASSKPTYLESWDSRSKKEKKSPRYP
jgi:hypothetical protein